MSDDLVKLTTDWNDAWNSRDAEKLASFFGDSGTYYEPDLPKAVSGKNGLAAVAQRTWDEWPSVKFEMVSVTMDAPRVALEWRTTATHKSGKEVQLEGVDVLTWDGNKIREARVYYDVHSRKVALGDA